MANREERRKNAAEAAKAGADNALQGDKPVKAPDVVVLPPGQELGEINKKPANAGTILKPRFLTFQVQFNPSELSLNTSALDINKQSVLLHAEKVEKSDTSATANLNVNLIFDKMSPLDAFVMDNGTLSTSGIQGGISGIGKTYTVRPEVEALLAALRNENTRQAEFMWHDFVFSGYLQYVQVRYTMFSPSGHPVRAVVAIRMKREATTDDKWVEGFDAVFSGMGGQFGNRTQTGGGTGGIINM
ncbi:MAG: hypothetical protein RR049_01270 [Angelakisella sp.]